MIDLQRAIHKSVVACMEHTIPEYSDQEHDALVAALSTVHDPRSVSSTSCNTCKMALTNAELVGNLLVQEVEAAWYIQRKEMKIILRPVSRGQCSVVESPSHCSQIRMLSTDREWKSVPVKEVVYPPESYLIHSLFLGDKALNTSMAPIEFNRGVSSLLKATVLSEREAFESETEAPKRTKGRRSVRVVTVRKPLTAVAADQYNLGRPSVGWYFESIFGNVEFYHD